MDDLLFLFTLYFVPNIFLSIWAMNMGEKREIGGGMAFAISLIWTFFVALIVIALNLFSL